MQPDEFRRLVRDGIARGVVEALKKAENKKDDGDDDDGSYEIECPYCGAEIDVPADDDDDEIQCPSCGQEVPLKAAKMVRATKAAGIGYQVFAPPNPSKLFR
ncbi:MAG: hypothetical protein ABSB23_22615 [Bryobacteraceae bacterium]|jgi:DNA-directed RNA polymerase subunit RPC12/RpoP